MPILLLAAAVLGLIARDIHFSGPVNRIDHEIQRFLLTELSQPLTQVMFVISWLGGVGIGYVAGLLALMLLLQREWTWLLSLGVTMGAHDRLTILLKALVHRPRPQIDHPILVVPDSSFPSGHAMAAAMLYGWLAVYAFNSIHKKPWRVGAVLGCCTMVLLVSLSRMYLQVHYFSDVFGGAMCGVVWLLASLTMAANCETLRNCIAPAQQTKGEAIGLSEGESS
jgi:undecaprenyl-diphosphatase